MPSILSRCTSGKGKGKGTGNGRGGGSGRTHMYLNVYDLTPVNNYLYWFGLGVFHSGIEEEKGEKRTVRVAIVGVGGGYRRGKEGSGKYKHLLSLVVHGTEYGFGAHDYRTSGVFEVEPKSCPGFIFRRSVWLGMTDVPHSEFRLFIEDMAGKYHGDTYHLIIKNCNHFTDEVSRHMTGQPIPGWVNRLARLG
ncbi:hypothetical protein BHM03_00036058 [Ensete ventricosum]|nr:hypothetical protein BHM03_00036058 [Ensete ventricosum]